MPTLKHPRERVAPTGADDATALQEALDRSSVVELSGEYLISQPLIVKQSRVVGSPSATITYTGAAFTGCLISVNGKGSGLERLTLDCRGKCSGVYCDSAWYTDDLLSHIRIDSARGTGVQLHNCWYSAVSDLRVVDCRGVALQCYQSNSVHYMNILITRCDMREAPPQAEAVIVLERCTVVELANLLIEPMQTADRPAVVVRSSAVAMRGFRCEGGSCGASMIIVDGDGWWTGAHVTLENGVVVGMDPPSDALVEVRGKARDVVISQVMASKYLKRIVNNPNNNPGVEVSHCTPAV